jgi:hypothetical protein
MIRAWWYVTAPIRPILRIWRKPWIERERLPRAFGLAVRQPGTGAGLFNLREMPRFFQTHQSLRTPCRFALLTFGLQSLDLIHD